MSDDIIRLLQELSDCISVIVDARLHIVALEAERDAARVQLSDAAKACEFWRELANARGDEIHDLEMEVIYQARDQRDAALDELARLRDALEGGK